MGFLQTFIRYIPQKIQDYRRAKNPDVINDGERILGLETDQNAKCHKARYNFAAQNINENDSVLDFACGTGYGSLLIAKHKRSAKIIGYDHNQVAINFGNKLYRCKNLILTTREPQKTFNTVIAFEYLEHTNNLTESFNHLYNKTRNKIIISMPYHEKPGNNPHHKHFNLDEKSLNLKDNAEIFYQNPKGHISKNETEKQNMIIIIKKIAAGL